jgi:hypothetical protein
MTASEAFTFDAGQVKPSTWEPPETWPSRETLDRLGDELHPVTPQVAVFRPPHPLAVDVLDCARIVSTTSRYPPAGPADMPVIAGVVAAPFVFGWLAEMLAERLMVANVAWRLEWEHLSIDSLSYGPGYEFPLHTDACCDGASLQSMKLTALVMLTDPATFDGGDLVFTSLREAPPAKLPQGSVVVVPPWVPHLVRPVRSGVRRTLVAHTYGPPLR